MSARGHGIGRGLARRDVLVLAGTSAGAMALAALGPKPMAGWLAGATGSIAAAGTPPGCVVRPAQTEGPYFVDERLNRADIRTDPESGDPSDGTPLALGFVVSRIDGDACEPLAGALVDVWHCDAAGVYSDVENAVGRKFLRGYQVTDATGSVSFTSIYPGWYPGRAVHVHFKIRTDPDAADGYEFTSQLYFDDALTDVVFADAPYAARGARPTRNADDAIYASGGDELLLAVTPNGSGHAATFAIGLAIPFVPCASAAACLATLDAVLPRPAGASSGATRRTARTLRARFAKAARLFRRAAATTGPKQAARRARARVQLERLRLACQTADSRGTLGASLAPVEAAIDAALALVA